MTRLTGYRFGEIKVNGVPYRHDLIVFQDEVFSPWIRNKGHCLCLDDLRWLLERHPKVILVGTGAFGRLRVPDEVIKCLGKRGILLLPLATEQVIAAYAQRAARGERVAVCLHISC